MVQAEMPLRAADEGCEMSGECVGATRAALRDVPGVRVSMSYSRGEAWLLKEFMLNVHNPSRLRELSEDPYYTKLLRKFSGLLKRSDDDAASVGTRVRSKTGADTAKILADWRRMLAAGVRTTCREYARDHGDCEWFVAKVTLKLRKSVPKPVAIRETVSESTLDEMYQVYRPIKAAGLWSHDLRSVLARRFGLKIHVGRRACGKLTARYLLETTPRQRRRKVDDGLGEALLRELLGVSENAGQEAAE